ncbi:NAD(P)/FAD-dependent oxidoreductase [Chelatococcus sp. GCM10030263]|uniref:NAD(P)/FAD-dependent oxidoreductase n=1 Tax=Chelatococcus sp. GCM10030263 TaxID=3273387 RepID=UPI0036159F34
MHVIVVGAGIVGSSVAYRAAQSGAQVTVLEASRAGAGTSGVSFAWTNANNKPPRAYHDLNVAGMRAHAALREEFGRAPWFHQSGSLEWRVARAEVAAQKEKVARLKEWGYAAEFIDKARLRELAPAVAAEAIPDEAAIVYCAEEGWVDPVLYAGTMLRAARDRYGARLKTGITVTGLETRNGRVIGARDARGELHGADVVINCTGRWSNDTVEGSAPTVPLAPTVGFLVFTPPVGIDLQRPLHGPDLDIRPDGAGRLMVRKDSLDDRFTRLESRTPDCEEAKIALASAAEILPELAGVEAEAVRTTVRPIPADGLSAVGPVRGLEGYYVVVTHSGVTLGPLLGQAVADEVVRGRQRSDLGPFRPGRFQA